MKGFFIFPISSISLCTCRSTFLITKTYLTLKPAVALFFLWFISSMLQAFFMNPKAVNQSLLHLLVRVYNQSIQSYYFFPDVIICGHHRLERSEFEQLAAEGFIMAYHTDSFGKLYRLTSTAETILREQRGRKRYRPRTKSIIWQTHFSFC